MEVFRKIIYDNLPLYWNCCKHQGYNEKTCRFHLKKTHNDVEIEEVEGRREQMIGKKFSGDLQQLMNKRSGLNEGDRRAGE